MIRPTGITTISKVLLVLAGIFLIANIFLPIWQIELYAPQYPEGLELKIYADSLAGNVEIINGLNHYIGMKTLHTEDFIEFRILKYIFIFFAVSFFAVALLGRKKLLYTLFGLFVFFAVVSMIDFYRWNYSYGHDLDPTAAIKVPGMAYQPPLIGYKQLLNFGAYSIPDKGGWLFIGAGILILMTVSIESGALKRIFRKKHTTIATTIIVGMLAFSSCSERGPQNVTLNKDMCAHCKMTITNVHFATQLITQKGRHNLFDDIICMSDFVRENPDVEYDLFYAADFSKPSHFVDVEKALFFESDSLRSPMGGNIAAFASKDSLSTYMQKFGGNEIQWSSISSTR